MESGPWRLLQAQASGRIRKAACRCLFVTSKTFRRLVSRSLKMENLAGSSRIPFFDLLETWRVLATQSHGSLRLLEVKTRLIAFWVGIGQGGVEVLGGGFQVVGPEVPAPGEKPPTRDSPLLKFIFPGPRDVDFVCCCLPRRWLTLPFIQVLRRNVRRRRRQLKGPKYVVHFCGVFPHCPNSLEWSLLTQTSSETTLCPVFQE